MISNIIERMGISHLLDYGCGDRALAKNLRVKSRLKYQAYDPEIPALSGSPIPAQMVVAIDAPDASLDELKRLTEGVIFMTIEGDLKDWLPKLWDRWDLQTVQQIAEGQYFVIGTCASMIENTAGEKI